jgi:hypothetical protein
VAVEQQDAEQVAQVGRRIEPVEASGRDHRHEVAGGLRVIGDRAVEIRRSNRRVIRDRKRRHAAR